MIETRLEARKVDLGAAARVAEQDLARFDARDARQDAHDRLGDHRLARARFADQRHRAALRHAKRHAVDRLDGAGIHVEIDPQVADRQKIGHSPSPRDQYTGPARKGRS
jgi:hypothetical protein